MDINVKMGPRADENFEKRDLQRTKSSKNGTYLSGDPLGLIVATKDKTEFVD